MGVKAGRQGTRETGEGRTIPTAVDTDVYRRLGKASSIFDLSLWHSKNNPLKTVLVGTALVADRKLYGHFLL